MKIFKDAVSEINRELGKLAVFDAALDSIIVFLVILIAISLFSLPVTYALWAAMAYFMAAAFIKLRQSSILKMESRFGFLKEKLRTAAEHMEVNNPVVDELHAEVLKELRNTDEGAFLNQKRTYIKAAVIALLCFILVVLAPASFPKIDISSDNKLSMPFEIGGGEGISKGKGSAGTLTPSQGSIYGEKSVAKLGNKELNVEIRPAGYELNVKDVRNVEKRVFREQYPEEIYAEPSEAYEENIPKEQLELVKNYFKSVAEG